jgi:hypothetical protein
MHGGRDMRHECRAVRERGHAEAYSVS